jgi:hypothetical protein
VGIGWLISLVMGVASIGSLNNSQSLSDGAANSIYTPSPTQATSAPSTSPTTTAPTALPGVGQPVTSRAGVSFTVAGAQCGLGAQADVFNDVSPKGQFCKIDFVVVNGSNQPQDVSNYDVFGYIGNSRYQAETSLGKFGDDYFSTTVNPGLSVNCSVFFDVPSGASLDRVKLITSWWGGDGATVALH